ncbi:MAG TPA: type II toxin-antitoxin system RelE/ParE family toxin [Opitutaceae bacterium]
MDFKLIWTDRAIGDLAEIIRHYREDEKSLAAAQKVGLAIIQRVEILQTFPEIGPRYPRENGIHREVLCYDYRIFYRVDRDAHVVYVARVWHGRQDTSTLTL